MQKVISMTDVIVHPTAEVSGQADIGHGTKIWHNAHIREDVVLGENCVIGKNAYIDRGVHIGMESKIQNNVSIYDATIGDHVMIGPGAIITNDLYPRAFIWNDEKRSHTVVESGASIGANSTIIGGVRIGKFAMIGAGSVVTRNVPAHTLVYGNPARIQGHICRCGKRINSNDGPFICDECKKKARL